MNAGKMRYGRADGLRSLSNSLNDFVRLTFGDKGGILK
jgi:hypothetical protein